MAATPDVAHRQEALQAEKTEVCLSCGFLSLLCLAHAEGMLAFEQVAGIYALE